MPIIRNFDDVELRFADVEEKIAVRFAETAANLDAIQNGCYVDIPTWETIQYNDRISALEKSMRDIKTLLMELVEKDIVSSWEAVVGDYLS